MSLEILYEIFINELFTLPVIIALLSGVICGIIVGALPGLTASMAVALIIPVTYGMDAVPALVMLVAVYVAAIYGGSIPAILIHTPGTPSSAATSLDGYQLTLKGEGARALSISTISSVFGGVLGGIALLFLAPPLAKVSLLFSSPEYFFIALFGLTIIGSLTGDSMLKGITAGAVGLGIGVVGMDLFTGFARFTYGVVSLQDGVSFVPAMIGLFSLSQVLIQIEHRHKDKARVIMQRLTGSLIPAWRDLKAIIFNLLRSSGIGIIIGIIPGPGGDIGAWVSYNEAKRFSKNKEEFGKGTIQGVAASESANNATAGGAMIPLMTLGIPGSALTAILLGGFILQGLTPGHELFSVHAYITYSIIIGFIIANILMGIIGLLGLKLFVKASSLSEGILAPIIITFCFVGSFAINRDFFDVWVMIAFGLLGYLMRKTGFHPAPLILGMILGPIAEKGFRQSLLISDGNIISYFFSRPISVLLMILIFVTLLTPFISSFKKKVKA